MIPQIQPYLSGTEATEVAKYITSGAWMTEFKKTHEIEQRLSEILKVKHVIMTTSGTAALSLACMAFAYNKFPHYRSVVLVPDFTMIATIHAVDLANCFANMKVELIDVRQDTLCMNPDSITESVENIVGVIHTDINGRCGNLPEIRELCTKQGWFLIEDACQALFSKYENTFLGTIGDIGCFSLSPQKIVTSGQGGIIVTNSDSLYERMCYLKDHGRVQPGVDEFKTIGFNFKYTDLQAVILNEQLNTIDIRVDNKKRVYNRYYHNFEKHPTIYMINNPDYITPWNVDIFINNRKEVMNILKEKGIGSRVVYPPIHRQYPFYMQGTNPITKHISKTGLWLPSSIDLSNKDIDQICDIIKRSVE